MKSVCVFSVIFPANLVYLNDFLESLSDQDFREFDLILFNDGVQNLENYTCKYGQLSIKIHSAEGTPAEIRQKGISYLVKSSYEKIIFADTDDYFSNNRISVSIKLLESNDAVVNDITLVSDRKAIIAEKYISNALKGNSIIDEEYLTDKNILGLSNTAINKKHLFELEINSEIIAVDWFVFATWFSVKKLKAVFSDKAITFYRQHNANTVGIGAINERSILNAIKVKLIHYKRLSGLNNLYKELFLKYDTLNTKLKDLVFREKYITYINSLNLKYPLWWEEAKEY